VLDLKQKLQDELLEKERIQIELKSLTERNVHEQRLLEERHSLDKERTKTSAERNM